MGVQIAYCNGRTPYKRIVETIGGGTAVLDLDYAEDSEADTDANFVMTGAGNIVEIQATAEKDPFSEDQLLTLLALARKGIGKLVDLQKLAVA